MARAIFLYNNATAHNETLEIEKLIDIDWLQSVYEIAAAFRGHDKVTLELLQDFYLWFHIIQGNLISFSHQTS